MISLLVCFLRELLRALLFIIDIVCGIFMLWLFLMILACGVFGAALITDNIVSGKLCEPVYCDGRVFWSMVAITIFLMNWYIGVYLALKTCPDLPWQTILVMGICVAGPLLVDIWMEHIKEKIDAVCMWMDHCREQCRVECTRADDEEEENAYFSIA